MSLIEGRAKKYDGTRIDYVSVFKWENGKCLEQITPSASGKWTYEYFENLNIGITYIANGCEPITHGAYNILGAFNPRKPLRGKQGLWYQVSDLSTLFQDDAGTIPVTTDGQPVGLIKDKSDNGNDASQAVPSKRPTYRTDGVKHWLQFSGTQKMTTQSFMISASTGHTHVIRASYAPDVGEPIITASDSGNGNYLNRIGVFFNMSNKAHRTFTFVPSGGAGVSASFAFDAVKGAITFNKASTMSSYMVTGDNKINLRVDGLFIAKSPSTALVDVDRSGSLSIGGQSYREDLNFKGNLYELVHISSPISEPNLLDLETYLSPIL